MVSVSSRVQALAAGGFCVLVAVAAAVLVDGRLDRHWILRGLTLALALCCASLLVGDQTRRLRRIIVAVGLTMFGVVFPVTTTTWASPAEIDFALAVATDAKAAAIKAGRTAVTVDDVRAVVTARGGAVGSVPADEPAGRGADAYPLVLRADPAQGRPRACLSFTGLDAKVRSC
ncbi:hypothetical protein E1263_19190 [Kribbella antibiotica]|uniref:Uncharacterized protein n=1 Tax=Kribbella antibiotica TaxID=190195 RepID=A0A4R4ZIM5_9ACTN|nr:hypothetical protein [Kribbella antibiotica]TDD58443.1 hypothetical protein E1263_19190 [Kribbella antibiotica]